jgi:hypothetical protein
MAGFKKGNVEKGAQHGNAFAALSRVDFGLPYEMRSRFLWGYLIFEFRI